MNVYLERPPTDRDFLIFRTINANPKVCTVPDKVKMSENSPSLKRKYIRRMTTANTIQYAASYFLKRLIYDDFDIKRLSKSILY